MKLEKKIYSNGMWNVTVRFFVDNNKMWQGEFKYGGMNGYRKNEFMVGKYFYTYPSSIDNSRYYL